MTTWTSDIHRVPSISIRLGSQHGLPRQYRLWTSAWHRAAGWTTNTTIALSDSTGYRHRHAFRWQIGSPGYRHQHIPWSQQVHQHQHGLRWQPGPQTSACLCWWQIPDTNMATSSSTEPPRGPQASTLDRGFSTDHRHQQVLGCGTDHGDQHGLRGFWGQHRQ